MDLNILCYYAWIPYFLWNFFNVNLIYYIALIFVGLHLFNQIIKLDINNSEICLKLFKSNSILGLLVCVCLIVNIL